MSAPRLLLLWALAAPLTALAEAPANPFVAQAQENFEALDFERCLSRLAQAQTRQSTPQELVLIELYAGLCHFHLGRETEAAEHFRMARRLDPTVQLPADVGPKVHHFFDTATSESPREAAVPVPSDVPQTQTATPGNRPALLRPPPPPEGLPPAAQPSSLAEAPRGRSLLVPLLLGGATALSLGTGVGLGLHARSRERQAHAALYRSEAEGLAADARQAARMANVSYAVAGATAVGALAVYFLTSN